MVFYRHGIAKRVVEHPIMFRFFPAIDRNLIRCGMVLRRRAGDTEAAGSECIRTGRQGDSDAGAGRPDPPDRRRAGRVKSITDHA